jgi:hypothetical protein
MKNWKVLLGLGGACAICCSIPLAGVVATLAAGASGALALNPEALLPAAGIALVASLAGILLVARQRRRGAASAASESCGCAGASRTASSDCGNAGSC